MSRSNSVVDLRDDKTYNSTSLARFAWKDNPIGENGVLHVEFEDGSKYAYMGVPQHLATELKDRALNPEKHTQSVGQFFYYEIRDEFERFGEDYARVTQ